MPDLSIVIVNWNGANFLPDCIKSIIENPPSISFEIVIVDNASSDTSIEWLKSDVATEILKGTRFKLIESAENLGFGRGNNLAFEQTTSPFVFVLNPDTKATPNAINRLLETLNSDGRIGIVGPKLLNRDGSLQPSVFVQPPTPASIFIEGFQLGRVIPRRLLRSWVLGDYWDHDERKAVPMVVGAAMMCRREVIEESGGFDPAIHMYHEESEWCVRISRRGWKVYFEPDSTFVHDRGKSSEQRWSPSELTIVQEKSLIYYEGKMFSPLLNLANSISRILVFSMHLLRWKLRRSDPTMFKQLIGLYARHCDQVISKSFRD